MCICTMYLLTANRYFEGSELIHSNLLYLSNLQVKHNHLAHENKQNHINACNVIYKRIPRYDHFAISAKLK